MISETAPQDESALAVFLGKNVFLSEMTRDFLADNNSAHGGRDDGGRLVGS